MNKQKHVLTVFILAIGLMGLFSCKKDKSTTTTPTTTGKSFYCKIDGTASEPGTGRYYAVASGSGIQIVGDNSATTLEIYLSAATAGTYTLGGNSSANFASVYTNANGAKVSTEGEVKITKVDGTKISGTFHYKCTGTAGSSDVADGEFNNIEKK